MFGVLCQSIVGVVSVDCERRRDLLSYFSDAAEVFMSLTRPTVDSILAPPGQQMAAQHNDRTIPQVEQEEYEYVGVVRCDKWMQLELILGSQL